ncbi:SDR family NAD(P)-dependent oxidoreductase [Staphylococcus succinus]|uniref:SDR family NAD(P)-dependent oxidoreductase n=1 Tax=Staphylococcus succinus TaxID=61015 RepID=UPI000E6791D4|nr:glucose 1-dehydrogenase [Staphylococcus succinus]RIN27603.1 glucose 1-dehydrogenase [Staphylococcus succinus]RIN40403.1 glucose 1-dehydrogenase [Staphylococcus succinus]
MTKGFDDLKGKNIVVTGGNKGIGQQISKDLAEFGANIIVIGRDITSLNETLTILKRNGGYHSIYVLDITKINEVEKTIETIIKNYGTIDVLVNNAGINITKPALEIQEDDWDKVLDINLKSLFFISQFVGKYMSKEGKGKIINIASQVGFVGYFNRAPYASSKGGVIQLTKSLAVEWAKYNINVNAVAPTFVETSLTEKMFENQEFKEDVLERILFHKLPTPNDISGAVLYLSSQLSNFVTGETIKVDGGWTAM